MGGVYLSEPILINVFKNKQQYLLASEPIIQYHHQHQLVDQLNKLMGRLGLVVPSRIIICI